MSEQIKLHLKCPRCGRSRESLPISGICVTCSIDIAVRAKLAECGYLAKQYTAKDWPVRPIYGNAVLSARFDDPDMRTGSSKR